MRNRPEWLVAFVAASLWGVAVPLNSWGKAQELQQGLEDSEASLVFADEARLGYIRELNVSLTAVSADGESTDHTTAMADIFERDTAAVAEVVASIDTTPLF